MDITRYYEKIYWEKNTKGYWYPSIEPDGVPIELISDSHLRCLPNYIHKKYDRIIFIKDIPLFIRKEIELRGMIINRDFSVENKPTKKKIETKSIDLIKGTNKNRLLLNKLKKEEV